MLIEVEDLKKHFGRSNVLRGVSFQLEAGEIIALAGPNGAGKTTALRILMGFLAADGGTIHVFGEDPLNRRHLAKIGWMPERPAFPPQLRLAALIDFQAGTFPTWDPALADELIERLELNPSARADQLSRGQSARLALLFALAHRPRLVLLDDPTLGLDPAARRLLLGELLASAAEAGTGVLLSTHLLAEAEWSLDRLLILNRGRIEIDDSMAALKASCRKILLPSGAPELPSQLMPVKGPDGLYCTDFDDEIWQGFAQAVPGARTETVNVEDIYIALTEKRA